MNLHERTQTFARDARALQGDIPALVGDDFDILFVSLGATAERIAEIRNLVAGLVASAQKKAARPVTLTCPKCGSADITRDACARWNPATDDWELSSTYDLMTCSDCGEEFYEAAEKPMEKTDAD